MRLGTWNARSLYMAGSLITVARVIPKYKLDLVEVQEVRWERGGIEPAGYYTIIQPWKYTVESKHEYS
jgi:hypothetical protein